MLRHRSRSLVVFILLSAMFHLGGVSLLLAANGSVEGRVIVEGGKLPQGTIVRATEISGAASLRATIQDDGTYKIPSIPEGPYRFELVAPDGTILGTTRTLITPSVVHLNLKATVRPSALTAPKPETPKAAPPKPTPPKVDYKKPPKTPWSNKEKWAVAGSIIGAFGAGYLVGDDDDASPSS